MKAGRAGAPGPDGVHPLGWFRARTRSGFDRATSLELRWFGRGAPPEELVRLTGSIAVEARTDRYAPLDRDDVTLKFRGRSRLSLKQRRCSVPLLSGLPDGERWSRRGGRSDVAPGGKSWVVVAKRRRRIVVDLGRSEPARASGGRSKVVRGGGIELVTLRVGAQRDRLWSVACESWGPHDRDDLVRLLAWSRLDLSAVDDCAWLAGGYAEVLRRLAQTGPA